MNPTNSEKRYWQQIAELGCIACLIDGRMNTHVSIHHCAGRTRKGCHSKVLALCDRHHQTGGEDAPSIHPWKARFEAKYGTQEDLMEATLNRLKNNHDELLGVDKCA